MYDGELSQFRLGKMACKKKNSGDKIANLQGHQIFALAVSAKSA